MSGAAGRLLAVALVASLAAAPCPAARAQEQEEQEGQEEAGQEPRVETVITVTATRLPYEQDEITASTRVVTADEIALRPGTGLDEALRWIPELSLFRRAPARAAHPTTHGINVRGVAPSGTSRGLVLVDGVPLADGFGGWVQWDRVPMLALERVEVALGGGPAPFGNQALAGTVQLVTRAVAPEPMVRLHGQVGTDATWQSGAAVSWRPAAAGVLAAARATGTDGYVGVTPAQRGPVDTRLTSRAVSGLLKLDLSGPWRVTGDAFTAHRDNGTPLQTNRVGGFGGAVAYLPSDADAPSGLSATAFARRSDLESVFTSVNDRRTGEVAVLDQDVDSADLGGFVSAWSSPAAAVRAAYGADVRHSRGSSRESVLLAGLTREPGGAQTVGGAWASARLAPAASPWVLEGSLRADAWRQSPRLDVDPAHGGHALSPRAGVLWQGTGGWMLRGSGYGSFRAPTLNELYRQFRVGDVVTAANPALDEERLWGAELGGVWSGRLGAAPVRVEATAYWNRLDDAVTNATVQIRDGLVFRQRRNLGAARVRGLEVDARARHGRLAMGLRAALLETDILAGSEPGDDSVVGNALPQVPAWRLTASATWAMPGGPVAVVGVHATGRQFEDDLNSLSLASGATVDVAVDWPLGAGVSLGLQAQNLLDSRLEVARTPVLVIGPPRGLAIGLTLSPDA